MIAKEEFIKRLTRGILNEINDAPRKSAWTSGVCSYAVDILSRYIDCRGFNIWDEVAQIGKITEEDLLNNAKDWRQYSRDGRSLIYNKDICHRCCSWKTGNGYRMGSSP